MPKRTLVLLGATGLLGLGCVNVKAPEQIHIGSGPPPERVDSSRVPDPATLDEAREELHKAYRHIRYLEHEVADLRKDKEKLKAERDEYKKKYKRLADD
jgi:hypothetical protein